MKVPIPDDWDDESWFCLQIEWPDSPKWVGILLGLILAVKKGRFWDEKTGRITDVQTIARAIHDRNVPFSYCSDCTSSNSAGALDFGNLIDAETIGGILMDCSIPFGAMKWVGGVLYYRYCGEWYPVVGDSSAGGVTGSIVPQPDDPDSLPPGEPDAGQTTATACSKALAILDVVHGIVDEAFDATNEGVIVPTTIMNRIKARYPYIDFGDSALISVPMNALAINASGEEDDSDKAEFKQRLACAVSSVISDGNQGLTKDERAAVESKINEVTGSTWGIWSNPLTFSLWHMIYRAAYRSIGANDTVNITSYVYADGSEDCGCIGEPPGGWILPDDTDGESAVSPSGWYLSRNFVNDFPIYKYPTNATSFLNIMRGCIKQPIRGYVMRLNVLTGGYTTKRMGYYSGGFPVPTIDVALQSTDTSDAWGGGPIVITSSDTCKNEIVAVWDTVGWAARFNGDYANSAAPSLAANQIIGLRMDINSGGDPNMLIIHEFRAIYHVDDNV